MSRSDVYAVAGKIADGLGGEPYYGVVVVEDGAISEVVRAPGEDGLPSALASVREKAAAAGKTVDAVHAGTSAIVPGFVDLHVHGGAGADVMDADPQGLRTMIAHHLRHGTTSLVATTMTASKEDIDRALEAVETFRRSSPLGRAVIGVHLEGPFISHKYPGAQNPAHISPARREWLEEWTARHPGLIRILTLAPETEGAEETIRYAVSNGVVAACGHTDATYDIMKQAIGWGVTHSVHCCNGMRPFHHREPGVVGAILLHPELSTELIMDGHHLHPASSNLVRQVKGDRVCLVTDAMRASGMPDGDSSLGGLEVVVRDGVARLKGDGSLAGSTLTMQAALSGLMTQHGLPLHRALPHATSIPAGIVGANGKGRIAAGFAADLLLFDEEAHAVRNVMLGGEWIDFQNGGTVE